MIFSATLTRYVKELSKPKYEPLGKEEELELFYQFSSGSIIAQEKLINAHLRFVVYLLRGYKIPSQVDPMDIIQEGNLGLIEGISRFDPSYDCRIFTYARHYILWYVGRALAFYSKINQYYTFPENFNINEVEDLNSEKDERIKKEAHSHILKKISKILNAKELAIIKLRFGLEFPFKTHTLKEIGLLLHTDPEKIRQMKEEALEKIKQQQNVINLLDV
jgi:RNA polymerase sigma factor (sigma-70 family)